MKPKDIMPKNSKGEYHGYQERYNYNGKLTIRVVYKNGKEVGYEEWHELKKTTLYIR